jgi:hypothetical protein
MGLNEKSAGIWGLSLEQIEATVADHLGRGRVPGNLDLVSVARCLCISRKMWLVGAPPGSGASTTAATTPQCFTPLQRLSTFETVDALIEVLTAALSPTMEGQLTQRFERGWSTALIDAVAARVSEQISAG